MSFHTAVRIAVDLLDFANSGHPLQWTLNSVDVQISEKGTERKLEGIHTDGDHFIATVVWGGEGTNYLEPKSRKLKAAKENSVLFFPGIKYEELASMNNITPFKGLAHGASKKEPPPEW